MSRKIEYKVLKAEKLMTKQQKPYYNLELLESLEAGGRRHEAKIWEDFLLKIPESSLPQVGQYWGGVDSRKNIFQGKEQLIIEGYELLYESLVTTYEKEQFEEIPVVDVEMVIDRMFFWKFWDPEMRDLMFAVASELRADGMFDKIRSIPAGASYHHSVKGGFLLHIDELLSFADALCRMREITPETLEDPGTWVKGRPFVIVEGLAHYAGVVDYQILRAAIVLHDIGKVYDYDEQTLQFMSNPVSECLEHTLVGVQMVDRHWPKETTTLESIDRELRLKHAIAAHHGQERGAVVPKTPEAILLHHLDMISASLDVCRRAYKEAKQGIVPEYSKMLGARPFVPKFFPSEDQVIYRVDWKNVLQEAPEGKTKLPWES